MILEAQKNSYFKKVVNSATIVFADGIGVLWALDFTKNSKNCYLFHRKKNTLNSIMLKLLSFISILCYFIYTFLKLLLSSKYRGSIMQYRTHGIDLIYRICESNSISNKKIFLLGAEEMVANKAALNLKKKYPNIDIVGAEEGIKKNQKSESIDQDLIERINKAKTNILLVAFGSPKQEIWIYENLKKMPSVKPAIGIGGSFDFISGKVKRAPLYFQKMGLEWLWRFLLEPKRIKRIYKATVKFPMLILKDRINKL